MYQLRRFTALQLLGRIQRLQPQITLSFIKQVIIVLIHHHCLKWASRPHPAKPKLTETWYALDIEQVLQRAEIPKILACTKLWFGKAEKHVVETVLLHGCCPLDWVISDVGMNGMGMYLLEFFH